MSGGAFDYKQFYIRLIAEDIESEIDRRDYSDEVIEKFKEAVRILNKAEIYAQRIDWLLSGDDSEESFIKTLKEDLSKSDI